MTSSTQDIDHATPALIYGRVSTGRQAESELGLEAQRSRCEAYCLALDLLPTDWLADEGVSGSVEPAKRPAMSIALARLADGEAKALVALDVDRIGRDATDVLQLASLAKAEGWRLVVVQMGLDTTTPVGRMVLGHLAVNAEYERAMISERTSRALQAAKTRGTRLRPPSEATRQAGRIAQPLRAEGATLQAIADRLNADALPTSRGGHWTAKQVSRALKSVELDDEAEAIRAARVDQLPLDQTV